MRRVWVIVAAVAIAAGGTLLYFGVHGRKQANIEHPQRPSSTTKSSVLLPEGTWPFGSGPAGFVVGHMHAVGGPKTQRGTMPDSPVPGVVELHRQGDNTLLEKIAVGTTGRFRVDLPVGDYYFVGRPASGSDLLNSSGFSITAGHTTAVELVEQLT
jgi:hypothetical protein